MFILKGVRTARIKTYKDHDHQCSECKYFDLTVKVYKEYFHFFFLPISATGSKTVKIVCNTCGQLFRSDKLNKQYESKTNTPFYLYSGVILVSCFILACITISIFSQNENSRFVANPKVGDVYLINKEQGQSTSYYYLRIAGMSGDSVIMYHSNLEYLNYSSEFNGEDYFVSGEKVIYTRDLLKEMLQKGVINSVKRDYDAESGFNRLK